MLFLISVSDGETTIRPLDDEHAFLTLLARGNYGAAPVFLNERTFAATARPGFSTNNWPEGATLLIRGKIVVPKPVTITTCYELE